jgi:N-acyl-D-aspartate/D-glutamate deacylase
VHIASTAYNAAPAKPAGLVRELTGVAGASIMAIHVHRSRHHRFKRPKPMIRSSITRTVCTVMLVAAWAVSATTRPALTSARDSSLHEQPIAYDVLIRNGRVLDGSGNPWISADVAITGDRIGAIGRLDRSTAARSIDATGLYVAPGFIDTHTHDGPGLTTAALSAAQPQLAQGITTVFINPDGGGDVDLAAQRTKLLKNPLGVNVAQFIGHGSVREAVMGTVDRHATPAEIEQMRALVRRGMQEGAWGLSAGPFYVPGNYADTAEFVALAKVAAEHGGVFQSHIRDESNYSIGVLASVEEVITVAREARLPSIVTHIKALGPGVWGFSMPIVRRIEQARAEGLEVWADQYPYDASATSLQAALVPAWAQAGGTGALRARLSDPALGAKIRSEMTENLRRRGGAGRIQFRRFVPEPSIEGLTLARVAADRRMDPVDAAIDLIAKGSAGIVSRSMDEDDVRVFMRQRWTMTASDGDLVPFGEGVPHPRSYGTFPRKIRRYVVDDHVLALEDAVRSMTSLPARVFGLNDRGELRPGAHADIVVFDLANVRDRATYSQPHQLAEGMVHVFVNGRAAIANGKFTAERAGRILRRDEQR